MESKDKVQGYDRSLKKAERSTFFRSVTEPIRRSLNSRIDFDAFTSIGSAFQGDITRTLKKCFRQSTLKFGF